MSVSGGNANPQTNRHPLSFVYTCHMEEMPIFQDFFLFLLHMFAILSQRLPTLAHFLSSNTLPINFFNKMSYYILKDNKIRFSEHKTIK